MHYEAAEMTAAEFRFREGIWSAAPDDAVEELVIRTCRFGPILATVCAGLPGAPLLNQVLGAAEPGAVAGGHLAEAVEWIAEHDVEYLVRVSHGRPEARQAERWLAERGYEQGLASRRFRRSLKEPVEPGAEEIEVRELSPYETEGMSWILAIALGICELATVAVIDLPSLEGWHCYAAHLEGREAACGALFIDGGIALLGLDATYAHARRRGCQSALIARRLADAKQAGCHTVFADTCELPEGRAAARNLTRAGFLETGRSVGWQLPPQGYGDEVRLRTRIEE